MKDHTTVGEMNTAGIDMGDRFSWYCVLDRSGTVIEEDRLFSSREAFEYEFGRRPAMRMALEAGTHSPWASRLLKELGHEIYVANPRKLRLIYQSDKKDDRMDALWLARVARLDPELLAPIEHRGEQAQIDLARIRARDALVRSRTALINHVRGSVKGIGGRLPKCTAEGFPKVAPHIPKALWPVLSSAVNQIADLTRDIGKYDRQIERLCQQKYPETERLRQVSGVGPVTSLAYVLTIEDPNRFEDRRDVGPFFGLVPRRHDSGAKKSQLRITKAGDSFLRRLLVGSAQYILGPFGPDCDLRRCGRELAKRGGKNAKKRAVVAVARRLSVLLLTLWVTGEVYEPFRATKRRQAGRALAK